MRLIIFCLYLLAFFCNAKAQNCTKIEAYFPLNKGLVYDYNANQVTELNTEALAILNIKDANLCDNFAVFDVAHYRMKGFATDGYAEDIAAYKKGCAAQKPYYLLFTRKYDENLELEKIDVEFSLPTEKRFSCLTEMQRSLLKIRLEQLMVEKLKIDKEGYISEFAAIGEFKKQVETLVECCGEGNEKCNQICPTKDEMKIILAKEGFIPVEVSIKDKEKQPTVADVTNVAVSLDFEALSASTVAGEIITELNKRSNSRAFITDDDFYCQNGGFGKVLQDYKESLEDYDFILHLSRKDDKSSEGTVWIKIEGDLWSEEFGLLNQIGNKSGEDDKIKSVKVRLIFANIFAVQGFQIPNDAYLPYVGKTNELFKAKPNEVYYFDKKTTFFHGIFAGSYIALPDEKGMPIDPSQSYNICLARYKYADCIETKVVKWNLSVPPAEAKKQPIIEDWITKCSEKPVIDREKFKSYLTKYGLGATTYFKVTSPNKVESYITASGISDTPPSDAKNKTVFEIQEFKDGTIKVKAKFKEAGINKNCPTCNDVANEVLEKAIEEIEQRHYGKMGKMDPKKNAIDKELANGDLAGHAEIVDDGISILSNLGNLDPSAQRGITYSSMTIPEMLAAAAKGYNELVENAKIPAEVWEPGKQFPVRDFTGVVSGVGDQVIEDSKDLAGLVGMALTIITDPVAAYDGLSGFASSFAGDPWANTQKLVGGIASEGLQLENFNKGGTYALYGTGRVGVTIVKTALGASFLTSSASFMDKVKEVPKRLKNQGDDLVSAIKRILKKLQTMGIKNPQKYVDNITQAIKKRIKNGCDEDCALAGIGCLTGNTLVEIGQGKFLPMSSMQSGTMVNSFNYITKKKEQKAIITVEKFITTSILAFTLSSGSIIEATPNHPFYINSAYQEAKNLHIGDTLFSGNSKFITIIGIFAKDTIQEVYNLRVADNDNYFAGEDALLNTNCLVKRFEDAKFANLSKKFDALTDAEKIKFLEDFGGADDALLDVLGNGKAMAAWKKLSNQPEWVRKNKELLKKLDNQPDNFIDKVAEYYEKSIPSNTPSGFNGSGMYGQVEFNEFGHPKLLPHVSDPNHIVTMNMKGNYTSDMTDAKNALQAKLPQNEKIVKHNPNGGWSPFYIEKNGNLEGPYTWHHHQDGSSMYPIKKDIHDSIAGKHTGGKEIVTKYPDLIGFFNQP